MSGYAILVRPPIHNRRLGKVAVRRWGRRRPLERRRIPGVVRLHLLAVADASDEVHDGRWEA